MNKSAGVTLIELAVSLATAAIVASVAVPGFTGLVKDNRLTTNGNELFMSLSLARSEAVKRGVAVTVTPADATDGTNEWGGGWTVYVDSDGDGTVDGSEEQIRVGGELHTSQTFDGDDNAGNSVSSFGFRPTGLLDTALDTTLTPPLVFTLCDDRSGETGRQVTVSLLGRLNVATVACP